MRNGNAKLDIESNLQKLFGNEQSFHVICNVCQSLRTVEVKRLVQQEMFVLIRKARKNLQKELQHIKKIRHLIN